MQVAEAGNPRVLQPMDIYAGGLHLNKEIKYYLYSDSLISWKTKNNMPYIHTPLAVSINLPQNSRISYPYVLLCFALFVCFVTLEMVSN